MVHSQRRIGIAVEWRSFTFVVLVSSFALISFQSIADTIPSIQTIESISPAYMWQACGTSCTAYIYATPLAACKARNINNTLGSCTAPYANAPAGVCTAYNCNGYGGKAKKSSAQLCPTGYVYNSQTANCDRAIHSCPPSGTWILSSDQLTCSGCWNLGEILTQNNSCVGQQDKDFGPPACQGLKSSDQFQE